MLDGETIDNPLRSFVLNRDIVDHLTSQDADYSKPKGYETVRYPLSGLVGTEVPRRPELHRVLEHHLVGARIRGSFLSSVFAHIGGKKRHVGIPLRGALARQADSGKFEVEVRTRDGRLDQPYTGRVE